LPVGDLLAPVEKAELTRLGFVGNEAYGQF
jgi:hypothetical protein